MLVLTKRTTPVQITWWYIFCSFYLVPNKLLQILLLLGGSTASASGTRSRGGSGNNGTSNHHYARLLGRRAATRSRGASDFDGRHAPNGLGRAADGLRRATTNRLGRTTHRLGGASNGLRRASLHRLGRALLNLGGRALGLRRALALGRAAGALVLNTLHEDGAATLLRICSCGRVNGHVSRGVGKRVDSHSREGIGRNHWGESIWRKEKQMRIGKNKYSTISITEERHFCEKILFWELWPWELAMRRGVGRCGSLTCATAIAYLAFATRWRALVFLDARLPAWLSLSLRSFIICSRKPARYEYCFIKLIMRTYVICIECCRQWQG